MQQYKSPSSRLARLFHNSREQWKQRAADKQKKLRALETKVRDLTSSREQWKQRARTAEQDLRQLKEQSGTSPKKGGLLETSP